MTSPSGPTCAIRLAGKFAPNWTSRLSAPSLRRDATTMAQNNARAAGIGHVLSFDVRDVRDCRPPRGIPPGVLLTNPPYGERLGEEKELRPLYPTLGECAVKHFRGWRVFVFTGNPFGPMSRCSGAEQHPLFNGKIPCKLLELDTPSEPEA